MSNQPTPPRATITISELALRTYIGFNEWEREKKQDVIINLSLEFDPRDAVASDDVSMTVDYKKIKKDIIALVESSRLNLLETLVHRVCALCLEHPRVLAATVKIDKPHALRFTKSVSVEMRGEQ